MIQIYKTPKIFFNITPCFEVVVLQFHQKGGVPHPLLLHIRVFLFWVGVGGQRSGILSSDALMLVVVTDDNSLKFAYN